LQNKRFAERGHWRQNMVCAALTTNRWQKSNELCKALSNDIRQKSSKFCVTSSDNKLAAKIVQTQLLGTFSRQMQSLLGFCRHNLLSGHVRRLC